MKYRVTTNTNGEYRIEGEHTFKTGWPWNRQTETEWLPTNVYGEAPLDENGDLIDSEIKLYGALYIAENAMKGFVERDEPARDKWIPVEDLKR